MAEILPIRRETLSNQYKSYFPVVKLSLILFKSHAFWLYVMHGCHKNEIQKNKFDRISDHPKVHWTEICLINMEMIQHPRI